MGKMETSKKRGLNDIRVQPFNRNDIYADQQDTFSLSLSLAPCSKKHHDKRKRRAEKKPNAQFEM